MCFKRSSLIFLLLLPILTGIFNIVLYNGYNLKQDSQDIFVIADLRKDVITI